VWIMRNRKLPAWLVISLAMVVLIGVLASGCYGARSVPVGWSGVAVADDALFLGSKDGKVVAVDASGSYLWDVSLGNSKITVAIYGTPAVGGDLVYVTSYIKEGNLAYGKVYAIDSKSKTLKWAYPREGYLDGPVVGGAVVAQDRVYFGAADGKVYALDADSGNEIWRFETGDKIWSTPSIKDDTVFIGSFDNKLYALNAADGSEKWAPFETEGAIACTPLVDGNTIYFGSFDRHFYAVDANDGSLIWRSDVEGGRWFWAKPVAYNGVIYAGCVDGKVYVLDARSGDEITPAIDLESLISSSPVLVDSSVIIATEDGPVYSLDTGNNQVKQLADVGGKVYAPLSTSNGNVYVYTQEGNLYTLDAQTGTRSILLSSE